MDRAIFIHALHKSASMFLHRFFQNYAGQMGVRHYSPNARKNRRLDCLNENETNFCCGPIRQFATFPQGVTDIKIPNLPLNYTSPETYRIYQIRDPRDLLVSQYFSSAFIHKLGGKLDEKRRETLQQITVDEFCLKWSDWLINKYKHVFNIDAPNHIIVKYEQMVLHYPKWLSEIASFLSIPPQKTKRLKNFEKEFKPFEECMKHKRKMIPGDYKEKLKPETIKQLNSNFSQILEAFYP